MLRIEAGLIDSCTGPEPHGAVDGDSDSLSESETLAVIQLLHGLAKEKDRRAGLRADIKEWMRYENASVAELATYGETCSGSRAQVQRELDAARYIVKCLKAKLAARTRRDICF